MTQVARIGPLTCHFDPIGTLGLPWIGSGQLLDDPKFAKNEGSRLGTGHGPNQQTSQLVIRYAFRECALVVLVKLQLIKPPIESSLCE